MSEKRWVEGKEGVDVQERTQPLYTGRTLDLTKLPWCPGIVTFSEDFSATESDFPHLKGHTCIGICRIANRKSPLSEMTCDFPKSVSSKA